MKKLYQDKNILLCVFALFVTIITIAYYNVLWDYLLIAILFGASFCLGSHFKIRADGASKIWMQIALGLGIIGLSIFFLLFIGIGNKSLYLLIVLLCYISKIPTIHYKNEDMHSYRMAMRNIIETNSFFICLLMGLFIAYTMYGSAPIDKYDTLTKHLPITLYAVENGCWNYDVSESIVYGEAMLLQYTYLVFFLSVGAKKALVLFNVVLLFGLYGILESFTKNIYEKNNKYILAVIVLTTPFFFEFATVLYLEILPLFFLFSAFCGIANLDKQLIWDNMEYVALFCGFTLFVKLTSILTVAVLVIFIVGLGIYKGIKQYGVLCAIRKILTCIFLGIMPSFTSLLHVYRYTGNPVYPMFNGVFGSPYFQQSTFIDPFSNKLSFSLHSLIDIVFYTNKNIEMGRYGFGIFLLFVFLIPISICIVYLKDKNIKLLIWAVVGVFSYLINTITTYNSRYYSSVWILAIICISISISIIIELINRRLLRFWAYGCLSVGLLLPNCYYILTTSQFIYKSQKNESFVSNDYCEALVKAEKGAKVLGVTSAYQFKGQFEGYYTSTSWHNCTLDRIVDGTYSWDEYINSFDYLLIDKIGGDVWIGNDNITELAKQYCEEMIYENYCCSLFRVKKHFDDILMCETEGITCNVNEPITYSFENTYDEYYIEHLLSNESESAVPMRYQINWSDETGAYIGTDIMIYSAEPGKNVYCSVGIKRNELAKYGTLYVCSADENEVIVDGYSLKGTKDVINEEKSVFCKRERVK